MGSGHRVFIEGEGERDVDPAADCADRLRALAADPKFAPRADDLRSLADELVDDDLDSWTGVELVTAFPPDYSINPPRHDRIHGGLAGLVGVGVFAPVAWTWFSLHKASQAYLSVLDESHGTAKDTFISLWTSGFKGHLGWVHRLGPVAVVSFALIMVAALLVVVHRGAAARAEAAEEREARDAGASLVRELSVAQRILNGRRSDDPSRIEAVVKHSVKELLSAHKATQATAEGLRNAGDSVGQAMTTLTTATSDARSSAVAAADAAGHLSVASSSTIRTIDDALNRFLEGINSHLADLRRETSEVIVKSGEVTQESSSRVAAAANGITASQSELAHHLDDLARAGRQAGGGITTSVGSLQQAIDNVDASLARHESAMQAQASELTAARDAMERVLRVLGELGSFNGAGRAG
jgi:hypothetical protein